MNIQGVGAQFRDERLRQNLSLEDIAARTRIQAKFLEAIEKDDFGQFPGVVFARNFVRQYAVDLALDPEPLLALMPRLSHEAIRLPDPPARARAQRTRLSGSWSSFGWALTAVAALAGAWGYHNRAEIAQTWRAETWTKRVWQTAAGGRQKEAVAAAPKPQQQMSQAAVSPREPEVQVQVQVQVQAQPTTSEAAGPAQPGPATLSVPASPVQVVVTAQEPSWISVTADSRTAFVGLLKTNESREISAAGQVKILTGNAGGLVISLNGKTIDPLGPRGQIRTVRLTAEGSELLTKAPAAGPGLTGGSAGASTGDSAGENGPAGPL